MALVGNLIAISDEPDFQFSHQTLELGTVDKEEKLFWLTFQSRFHRTRQIMTRHDAARLVVAVVINAVKGIKTRPPLPFVSQYPITLDDRLGSNPTFALNAAEFAVLEYKSILPFIVVEVSSVLQNNLFAIASGKHELRHHTEPICSVPAH